VAVSWSLALSVWQDTQELTAGVAVAVDAAVVAVAVVDAPGSVVVDTGLSVLPPHPTRMAAAARQSNPMMRRASRVIMTSRGLAVRFPCRPGVRTGTGEMRGTEPLFTWGTSR
jgi:hypothetical protein